MPILRNLLWPLVLMVSTVLVGIMIGLGIDNTYRWLIVFAYLLICPGMAYVRLLNISSRLTEWMLAIAMSISIELILSEIMVLTHLWSPNAAFFTIAFFCMAGALVQIIFPRQVVVKSEGSR